MDCTLTPPAKPRPKAARKLPLQPPTALQAAKADKRATVFLAASKDEAKQLCRLGFKAVYTTDPPSTDFGPLAGRYVVLSIERIESKIGCAFLESLANLEPFPKVQHVYFSAKELTERTKEEIQERVKATDPLDLANYITDSPTDALSITVGPLDDKGRRLVTASLGRDSFPDAFDCNDRWRRSKFTEAVIDKFGLEPEAAKAIEDEILNKTVARNAEEAEADSETKPTAGPRAIITRLDSVQSKPVEWLWPGRVAMGKLTMLTGDAGLGKSYITLDMAARVSTGRSWPDSENIPQPTGGVVLLSAEDKLDDTVRPRLDALGANSRRIVALEAVAIGEGEDLASRGIDLSSDIDRIEEAIEEVGKCRLVVIDPVSAYMGGTDSHKNAAVRGVLSKLAKLADEKRVAVVMVTHLRKSEGKALHRSMGSVAFAAAARAAWCVVEDKADSEKRLMLPLKNNLANDTAGLAYCVKGDTPETTVVSWYDDPVTITADEAMAAPTVKRGRPAEEREEAETWLLDFLAESAKPSKEIRDTATNGQGFSWRTIERARNELGIEAFRPENPGPWFWRLPSTTPHSGGVPPSE